MKAGRKEEILGAFFQVFKSFNTYSMMDGKIPLQIAYLLSYQDESIASLTVQYATNRKNIEKVYFLNKELNFVEQCGFLITISKEDL